MTNCQHIERGTFAATGASGPAARLAYSVAEAGAVTGLGKTTLYGLIGSGRLPSVKVGNRRLIRSADLEALIGGGDRATA